MPTSADPASACVQRISTKYSRPRFASDAWSRSFSTSGAVGKPHDYGLIEGEPRLFFYQVGGESRSGRALGWRWAVLSKVSELRVLDEHFAD
ncbi:MAG: hypothetical protein ACXW16_10625 [Burkholderiaceae bacterium]